MGPAGQVMIKNFGIQILSFKNSEAERFNLGRLRDFWQTIGNHLQRSGTHRH